MNAIKKLVTSVGVKLGITKRKYTLGYYRKKFSGKVN